MSRRPATVTQADIARSLRAMKNAGLTVVRVIVRGDGALIETEAAPPIGDTETRPVEPKKVVVL